MNTIRPRVGVDMSLFHRDEPGKSRTLRQVLNHWEAERDRIVLLTLHRRQLANLKEYSAAGWRVQMYDEAPDLNVCWFPWSRVDWDPECPCVVSIQDLSAFSPYREAARHTEEERARLRDAARHADAVLTASNFCRAEIHHHLGFPLEDTEVVYLAQDPMFHQAPPGGQPLPEPLEGVPYLLYVGSSEPGKNLRGMLEAFALLERQIPHQLALVCRRPSTSWTDKLWGRYNELEEIAETLGSRLVWLDHHPDEELAELYRRCSLFIRPSFYEGFCMPMLEALACGAQVAAARSASLPEVGGSLPFWFNPKDSVDIARTTLEALSAAPRDPADVYAHLSHFNWHHSAEEILHFLDDVAEHPRRAHLSMVPPLPDDL